MKKIVLFIGLFVVAVTLTACTNDDGLLDGGAKNNEEVTDVNTTPETLQLTLAELAAYNGKDGNMAYIAVNGTIYDVTDEWNNGQHNGVMAGTDASVAINGAPHGTDILGSLEIIGELIE